MALLSEVFTNARIFLSYGPGLAFLLILHEAIRLGRPDIVDKENRVRGIDTSELLGSYDFIVVGGGSAGFNNFFAFFLMKSENNQTRKKS